MQTLCAKRVLQVSLRERLLQSDAVHVLFVEPEVWTPIRTLQVDILQHLGCSLNVAYCFGAFEERSCVGVVLEMCAGGELWSRIKAGHSEKGRTPCSTCII